LILIKQLGWDPEKKYILYVGRLYDLKQPKELIDIWKEIKIDRPDIKLVVIGNSADDEFYQYAIESGVIVLGRILNSELDKYYSASDVYVLMALRKDYFGGTGIAPLESLACNTPVVSYAMRNYVGNNMHELGEVPDTLEGYKDAILKVINNPDLYTNMRESMKKYYSLEAIASKVQSVYEGLMNSYNIN
jgi:glycosyltransferase involved in cell wall biosynthesis